MRNRSVGAYLYASLFSQHGFALAYTQYGQWIPSAQLMFEYIMALSDAGYRAQEDLWIGKDPKLLRRTINEEGTGWKGGMGVIFGAVGHGQG